MVGGWLMCLKLRLSLLAATDFRRRCTLKKQVYIWAGWSLPCSKSFHFRSFRLHVFNNTISTCNMSNSATSQPYPVPTPSSFQNMRPTASSFKKPWQRFRQPSHHSFRNNAPASREGLSQMDSLQGTASTRRQPQWWKIRLFHGMINDVRRRAPFYWSDWRDAWDYRVVPATVYMYFAKYGPVTRNVINGLLSTFAFQNLLQSLSCHVMYIVAHISNPAKLHAYMDVLRTHMDRSILPALAFSLDMFSKTDQSYGVNEVLLASVLASVVFSLFAAQPLTIVGVTGRCFT